MTTNEPTTGEIEEWKPVCGYEELYRVSNLGRVIRGTHEMKQFIRGRGYSAVRLCKDGKQRDATVHRLVAAAFCEQKDGCAYVNHINGDKRDNGAKNLEWCTMRENINHAYQHDLKLGNERPVICVETGERFRSLAEASTKLGATVAKVFRSCNGQQSFINGMRLQYETRGE